MTTKFPEIPEDQKTPLVQLLLRIIQEQANKIELLKDEIAKLKGQKPRPKIPPSNVSNDAKNKEKRSGSMEHNCLPQHVRRQKRKEQRIIQPTSIPPGARFKGYENYTVQDLNVDDTQARHQGKNGSMKYSAENMKVQP